MRFPTRPPLIPGGWLHSLPGVGGSIVVFPGTTGSRGHTPCYWPAKVSGAYRAFSDTTWCRYLDSVVQPCKDGGPVSYSAFAGVGDGAVWLKSGGYCLKVFSC